MTAFLMKLFRARGMLLPAVFTTALLIPRPGGAQTDRPDRVITAEQFLADAPAAWRNYRDHFTTWKQSINGTITSAGIRTIPQNEILWDYSMRVVTDANRVLLDISRQPTVKSRGTKHNVMREGYGINQEYAFNVQSRILGNASAPLIVEQLEHPVGEGVRRWSEIYLRDLRYASLIELPMVDLEELCQHPAFAITRVEHANVPSGVVVIEFEFSVKENQKKPYWGLRSGRLELDPEHHWCLRGAHLVVFLEKSWVELSVNIEPHTVESEGILIARKVTHEYIGDSYGGQTSVEYALQENAGPVPSETFQLSAFGLEEPVFENGKWSTATWLLMINGLILLMIGLFLLCKRYRPSARA